MNALDVIRCESFADQITADIRCTENEVSILSFKFALRFYIHKKALWFVLAISADWNSDAGWQIFFNNSMFKNCQVFGTVNHPGHIDKSVNFGQFG